MNRSSQLKALMANTSNTSEAPGRPKILMRRLRRRATAFEGQSRSAFNQQRASKKEY
jgi:hypothetical protein